MTCWTAADQAEQDVLLHGLTTGYAEHRQKKCNACQPCPEYEAWRQHVASCRACNGYAPLTYGLACEKPHDAWACPSCNPCPHLQVAIREALEWREVRLLLSRAEALRGEIAA